MCFKIEKMSPTDAPRCLADLITCVTKTRKFEVEGGNGRPARWWARRVAMVCADARNARNVVGVYAGGGGNLPVCPGSCPS